MSDENPMRQIRIDKVTLNVGVGGPGDELERSVKLLKDLTDMEPKKTKVKKRTGFSITKGRNIGVMVTMRGKKASDFLERIFEAEDNVIDINSFDNNGNFSIGVEEHIDIPGTEYDPDIGILGLDVVVTLERPGYRVKRRNISKPIGDNHKIKREEAVSFVEDKFGVTVNR